MPDSDGDLYSSRPLIIGPSQPLPASPTWTDYERMDEHEMECERDNHHEPSGSYYDPLAEWNACGQLTEWGSPMLSSQQKVYSPSHPTGDANPLNLA